MNNPHQNVKVAVAGCGYWGKNLVRNFGELGSLAAVTDLDLKAAEKMAAPFGAKALDWQAVLADRTIQGVVISTPAETHAKLAREAIRAGKHVFCEKPLAISLPDARDVCELAEKENRILMVGHLLQYHPAFLKLKEIIRAGTIGRLQYIYSHRMNLGKIRREENILWSFAPHDISMILALAGEEPIDVTATGSHFLHETIHDVTTTHLAFKNGIRGHIFVSWLHPFKEQKLVIIGEKGMLVFNDTLPWAEKLLHYPHKINWQDGMPVPEKGDAIPVPLEESEPLKLECLHFLESVSEENAPRTDGWEGLRVLSVLDKAQKSLEQKEQKSMTEKNGVFVHDSAEVDTPSNIGKGTKIWHYSHILKDVTIGENCVVAQNVMIGPDVKVGNNCKIQNNVSVYKGVTLEDGVFCGPSCVFTNVMNPRAEIERKNEFKKTLVRRGATIGANATIVCGTTLGEYCFIGAGAVVTKDVPAYALMVGNPARRTGWMSQAGAKLGKDLVCPVDGTKYQEVAGKLEPLTNKKEKAA